MSFIYPFSIHYTKLDTAINKILLNGEIRFGFLGDTHDPKENKEWRLVQTPFPNSNSPNKIDHVANEIRLKEWKVTCFSKHRYKALRGYSDVVMKPDYRRGDCFPRMWEQYGEKHKGVCLAINGKKFYEIIKEYFGGSSKIFHGHMRYQDETSTEANQEQIELHFHTLNIDRYGLTEAIRRHFRQHYKEIFLRKAIDWKSEREYRFLIHDKTKKPNLISIKKSN